jgi:ubiquinone/menaquinone biosynthesis C-methylase UbiE
MFNHLFKDIKAKKQMKVLDVGCGNGGNSIRLAKLNYDIVGVDISTKAISAARKKAAGSVLNKVDFYVCDIERMCFDDNTFDICFCGAVLHHFPDLDKVAQELHRVTKKNGKVITYDPNALHPYIFFVHNVLNRAYTLKGFSPNERALRPKELQFIFQAAGFTNFRFNSIILTTKKKRWHLVRNISYKTVDKLFSDIRKGNMLTMVCDKRV